MKRCLALLVIRSDQISCSVVSDSLRPHESQHSQASLSITNSLSSLRLTSIESVMPSSHLILCRHQRNANQNHEIPFYIVHRRTRIKCQIITSVDKDMEKSESLTVVGLWMGMLNDASTLENNLAIPQMIKHRVIVCPSNSIRYISRTNESICPHKDLYMNVYSGIIQYTKRQKQSKHPSADKWMIKCVLFVQWNFIWP